jgi:pimeloyl-ACP methyl ester carboxylesterase
MRKGTFVLVHGAWSGAWSVQRVAERLRAKVHRVYTPALSGLGERSHLAHLPIDLSTHIDDVTNEIVWQDLDDVVLVGASYAGFVITGVAEKIRDRLVALVYVDAFIPEDGQSFADLAGIELPTPVVPAPELTRDEVASDEDFAWVKAKSTPQPSATFTERLRVTGAYLQVPRKHYVRATSWEGPFDELLAKLRASDIELHEVDCGHDIMNLRPDELTKILTDIV